MRKGIFGIMFPAIVLFLVTSTLAYPVEQTVQFTVVRGDTLSNFCQEHLENGVRWREVAKINRLRDPDLIYPGQTLLVPADMLKGLKMDGLVTFVKGEVLFQSPKNQVWLPLASGATVREKTRIKTGSDGAAEIVFPTGTTLLLRSDTEIGVASLRDKGAVCFMERFILSSGKAVAVVRKSTGRQHRLRIRTPSAVAAVRGTEFRSGFDTDRTSRFEVLEGTVTIGGQGKTVTAEPGEGAIVRKGEAPTEPKRLLAPPRPVSLQPIYRRLPASLSFLHDAGTTACHVLLGSDREGRQVLREAFLGKEEPFVIPPQPDGTYYLRATGFDSDGLEGMPSPWIAVTVRANPAPPFLEAPLQNGEYPGKEVDIRWMKVRDAVRSQLQISPQPDFQTLMVDEKDIVATAYQARLPDYGTYVARISSVASDGFQGEWSDPVTFTLSATPPPPSLEQPALKKDEIQIRWQNLGPGVRYRVQISRDESFRTVLIERTVNHPQVVLPRPTESGVYHTRIAGIDAKGFQGDFSQPQTFEITAWRWFPTVFATGLALLTAILAF